MLQERFISSMTNESERLQILEMIEKGVISASEGVRLLNSLLGEPAEDNIPRLGTAPSIAGEPQGTSPAPEVIEENPLPEKKSSSAPFDYEAGIQKWRRWWWIPLTGGIVITVASAVLMFFAYQASGAGFWFACLWFPLLLGVVVISLAAASRTARWLHVRVHQEKGEWPKTIAISMPLPVRFVAWILRTFRPHIPNLDKTSLDEVILALNKTSPDQPFYVNVDEGESGEKVEVFIG
jgi:SHOCT-like domain